jgi:hypothetical protein
MVSNLVKTNVMAIEDVESIGNGFVTKYFDALMGKPNPSALRQLFNEQSVYVFAQHGYPDHEMYGMYLIGWFIKRMEYCKCTVTVCSIDTSARPHPAEFAVSTVCKLMRPEKDSPFMFTQTFIIKRVPWTRTEFQIVETRSKFDDEIEDDYLPKVVSIPINCKNTTLKTAKVSDNFRSPFEKVTGADKNLEESSHRRTDEIICTKKVFSKKIREKLQSTTKNRDGELNSGKISMASRTSTNSKNVGKHTDEKTNTTLRINSKTSSVKPTRGNEIVSRKKIAENPMMEILSVKNEPKVVLNLDKIKTKFAVKRNDINIQSNKFIIPAVIDKKTYISVNRFESLAVDDENNDSDSIIAVRQDNASNPSKDMPERINSRQKISKCFTKIKKSRKNPAVIRSTNEQRFAMKMSQNNDSIISAPSTRKSRKSEKMSAAVQASVQTDSFGKRDESTVRKLGIKMLDNVNEGYKGSISKKICALVPKEDSDALASDSISTVACNGRSKGSRRSRKRPNKRSNDVVSSYIHRAELRIRSIFKEVCQFFFNVTLNSLRW